MPAQDDNQPDEPEEEIEYFNNKDEWPEGLWEEWGDPPPDEKRCQFESGFFGERCGLPGYADDEEGSPRCIFHYEGDRDAAKLREELEAAVARKADLRRAKLQNANLRGAELQNANLSKAELQNADLYNAELQNAGLFGAKLQNADLRWANLQNADLAYANLRDAGLSGAKLQDGYLLRAELHNADLSYANLEKSNLVEANLRNVDLTRARITGSADLRSADLTDAVLWEVEISPQAKLDGVIWGEDEKGPLRCEREAQDKTHPDDMSQAEAFAKCEAVYRQIKLRYQESGDYRRAGDFFIREMECQRRWLVLEAGERGPKHLFERAFRWLMCATCRYGEDPKRLLGIMGGLVGIFAVVHMLAGFNQVQGGESAPVFMGWFQYNDNLGFVEAVWKAVYFSIVNFTSLGHGDLQPTAWGSLVCSIEVVLGVTLIALFMVCVARRFSR